jgi:tRNA C32,U32 (ribose-2'-O)-methylase TrmJ
MESGRTGTWTTGGAVAIVVGSERHGFAEGWLNAADERIGIPIPGSADSLNVAVAAGIVLFEATCKPNGAAPSPFSHRADRRPGGSAATAITQDFLLPCVSFAATVGR